MWIELFVLNKREGLYCRVRVFQGPIVLTVAWWSTIYSVYTDMIFGYV